MLSTSVISQPMKKRLSILRKKTDKQSLLVHEIYLSIQGESSYMGLPCVFIRTTGCHLRCSYCDTEQAFFQGQELSIESISKKISTFKIPLVELTGGEPLLQKTSFLLLDKLINDGFIVLLETSGAVSIAKVNRLVKVILDIKTPSSLEDKKTVLNNLELLWPGCEVKFVMSNHEDYLFAKDICYRYDLFDRTHVLFSPVTNLLDPKILVEWILEDKLPCRFQMQLHKVLYGDVAGK
jgi:7-carboxy-7-deazaguanine synthase